MVFPLARRDDHGHGHHGSGNSGGHQPYESCQLSIGTVTGFNGAVNVTLHVGANGDGEVFLYVAEGRRQGQLVRLGPDAYRQFVGLIGRTSETIRDLQASGKLRR